MHADGTFQNLTDRFSYGCKEFELTISIKNQHHGPGRTVTTNNQHQWQSA